MLPQRFSASAVYNNSNSDLQNTFLRFVQFDTYVYIQTNTTYSGKILNNSPSLKQEISSSIPEPLKPVIEKFSIDFTYCDSKLNLKI